MSERTAQKTVQVCIVSAEPMANVLPIKALRPDIVVLVVSSFMRKTGARLKWLLEARGIRVVEAFDAPDHDLSMISAFAADRFREMVDAGVPADWITLNATGGNKLMAMGFVEAARDAGIGQVIYADTAHDRIEFIHPEESAAIPMEDLATLEDLFESRGLRILKVDSADLTWRRGVKKRAELTRWMLRQSVQRGSPLLSLRKNLNGTGATSRRVPKNLTRRLRQEGLITALHPDKNGKFHPVDGAALFYLQGGWLEEYAWLEASRIEGATVYAGLRLQLSDDVDSGEGLHELDLVILHRNRLLLAECKVRKAKSSEADPDLDRLRMMAAMFAGPFGKLAYIVPEMPRIENIIQKRCADHPRIELATGKRLVDLQDWIRDRLDRP